MLGKVTAGIIGGFLVGACGFLLATIGLGPAIKSLNVDIFFLLWGFSFLLSLMMRNEGKAWRFNWIASAILCFSLPVSGLVFSSAPADSQTAGLGILEPVIHKILEIAYLESIGFFLGIAFLIFGLLAGKESTLMYIHHAGDEPVRGAEPEPQVILRKAPDSSVEYEMPEIREPGNGPSHWSKKHF